MPTAMPATSRCRCGPRFMKAATKGDKPEWLARPASVVARRGLPRVGQAAQTTAATAVEVVRTTGTLETRSMVYTEYFVEGDAADDGCASCTRRCRCWIGSPVSSARTASRSRPTRQDCRPPASAPAARSRRRRPGPRRLPPKRRTKTRKTRRPRTARRSGASGPRSSASARTRRTTRKTRRRSPAGATRGRGGTAPSPGRACGARSLAAGAR